MSEEDAGSGSRDDEYYVRQSSGQVIGPFDENEVEMMLDAGRIDADAELSTDRDEWRTLAEVSAFDVEAGEGTEAEDGDEPDLDLPTPKSDSGEETEIDLPAPADDDAEGGDGGESEFEQTQLGTSEPGDLPRPPSGEQEEIHADPPAPADEEPESTQGPELGPVPADSDVSTREYDQDDLQAKVEQHIQQGREESSLTETSGETELPTTPDDGSDGVDSPAPTRSVDEPPAVEGDDTHVDDPSRSDLPQPADESLEPSGESNLPRAADAPDLPDEEGESNLPTAADQRDAARSDSQLPTTPDEEDEHGLPAPSEPTEASDDGPGLPAPSTADDEDEESFRDSAGQTLGGDGEGLPTLSGEDEPVEEDDAPAPSEDDAFDSPDAQTEADADGKTLPGPAGTGGELFDEEEETGADGGRDDEIRGASPDETERGDLFSDGDGGDEIAPGESGAGDELFEVEDEPDDDLFGDASQGDELFEGDDEPESGLDDAAETGDELFEETADDDLFAEDDDPGESDIFGDDDEDELFADEDEGNEEDPFAGGETRADDTPFDTDPAEGLDEGGDDDFLDDDDFTFLEEESEAEPTPEAEASGSEQTGQPGETDLDPGTDPAPGGGIGPGPGETVDRDGDRTASGEPEDDEGGADDRFRPESPGLPEQESEAVHGEESGGSTVTLVATIVALLLVGAGGGYYAYRTYLAKPKKKAKKKKKKQIPTYVSLDASSLVSDAYSDMIALIDKGRAHAVKGTDRGELLFAEALFLARFEDPEVSEHASKLAKEIQNPEETYLRLGEGAWQAVEGNLQGAAATLGPLTDRTGSDAGSDGEENGGSLETYFAELSLGLGHVLALDDRTNARDESASKPKNLPSAPSELKKKVEGGEPAAEKTGDSTGRASADTERSDGPSEDVLAKRARTHLERAAEIKSGTGAPYYWIGRLEEFRESTDEALEAYERAVERQNVHVPSRVRAAKLHYDRGNLEEARTHTEQILTQLGSVAAPSETAEAYHVTGQIHLARAQNTKAINALTKALQKDPDRTETLRLLARTYERAGKYQEALHFFTSNEKLSTSNPEVLLGIARSHIGLKNWKKAVDRLEEGEKAHPEDGRFPYYLGRLHMKRGALAEARKAMKRAVERDPSRLDAWATLAQLAWRLDKNAAQAENYIRKIVERPEQISSTVARKIAKQYRLRSRLSLSKQWYEEALERNPNSWPARLNLAKLHLRTGSPEQALEHLRAAKKAGVDDTRLTAYLADAYRQAEQYDRAMDAIDRALKEDPENAQFMFIRGRIQFDRGNHESARRDFNKAYEYDPQFHRAYYFVGRSAFEQGDYKNTLRILRHVLDYKPKVGEYRYWMGRALEARDRLKAALRQYRKATKFDENYGRENPKLYIRRGRLLVELGKPKKGKKDIQTALEIDPDMPEALLALGYADFKTQDYESAIDHLERALDKEPDHPKAQYKLGMSLIYTEQRREGAEHLQRAVEYGYENPEIYQTLGYLYKELGRQQLAVEAFKSFLRQMPKEKLSTSTRRETLNQIENLGG
ncbi:MAG: tetratricopeptide repeat protein [Bradymonadaceae bacterium]